MCSCASSSLRSEIVIIEYLSLFIKYDELINVFDDKPSTTNSSIIMMIMNIFNNRYGRNVYQALLCSWKRCCVE